MSPVLSIMSFFTIIQTFIYYLYTGILNQDGLAATHVSNIFDTFIFDIKSIKTPHMP
jgi:hypothetical protein